jgi:hypothetical protein
MNKKIIVGLLAVLVIAGGIIWFRTSRRPQEKITPEITLEQSKLIPAASLAPVLTEKEKAAIEEVFKQKGAEMTMLKNVSGGPAVGTAWRLFENKFYFKLELNRLTETGKGFYYEAWLVGPTGFFSLGRAAESNGTARLYYLNNQDKSEFKGVVVTLEPEDGNPAPDKHILEGSF